MYTQKFTHRHRSTQGKETLHYSESLLFFFFFFSFCFSSFIESHKPPRRKKSTHLKLLKQNYCIIAITYCLVIVNIKTFSPDLIFNSISHTKWTQKTEEKTQIKKPPRPFRTELKLQMPFFVIFFNQIIGIVVIFWMKR